MAQCHCTRKLTFIMIGFGCVLIVALTLGLVFGLGNGNKNNRDDTTPSFSIDHEANIFLKDGEPFRYVAGAFHYFRAVPEAWRNRLRTMRAAGLNALDTYIEWSMHNPQDGVYNWEGIADIVNFIKIAQEEGFLIILRPGPYICAERDNGGIPYWLFTKHPNMKLRTYDENYLAEITKWYGEVMPRLKPLFYGNGGPIIMVQVENEYASFDACDHDYLNWLRDETQKYTEDKALLFTSDMPNEYMECGKVEGVFATANFGTDRMHDIDEVWKFLRKVQPTGPLVNSEFYPGWPTYWHEEYQRRSGSVVAEALRTMLTQGANVNIYMFFGGTNFGFTAGGGLSYLDSTESSYSSVITSYDFDAVLDEAGGITPKYELIRNVIKEFQEVPEIALSPVKRLAYGKVELKPVIELLSEEGRTLLAKDKPVQSISPKSFEELGQFSGLVLYETTLPKLEVDPAQLCIESLHDRAFVYVDQQFVGTLTRKNNINTIPLNKGWGTHLQLLVENQGRISYKIMNDTKGILGAVTVQRLNGEQQALVDWTMTSYPLDKVNTKDFEKHLSKINSKVEIQFQTLLRSGPIVYKGSFNANEIGDTYLNMSGWGKGVAYVNDYNLGRYWPLAGPQITLYVPKELLQQGENTIVLIEYQRVNINVNNMEFPTVTLEAEAQLGLNGGEP